MSANIYCLNIVETFFSIMQNNREVLIITDSAINVVVIPKAIP